MNPKIERLKAMAEELRQMFPGKNPELQYPDYAGVRLILHSEDGYDLDSALMRDLGIGKREKQVHGDDENHLWFYLVGDTDGVQVQLYGKGLPKSCHVEIYYDKIPKQQTVDSGEFIEVKRSRIVCGEPEKEEA